MTTVLSFTPSVSKVNKDRRSLKFPSNPKTHLYKLSRSGLGPGPDPLQTVLYKRQASIAEPDFMGREKQGCNAELYFQDCIAALLFMPLKSDCTIQEARLLLYALTFWVEKSDATMQNCKCVWTLLSSV